MQYNLISAALSTGVDYQRIINITGTDYPAFSNQRLYKLFTDSEKEFITGFDISQESVNSARKPLKDRVTYYYLFDAPKIMKKLINSLKIKKFSSYEDIGIDFYEGSEYWALTRECVQELIMNFDNDYKLQDSLYNAFVPSEMWIHTLFFNSRWARRGDLYPNHEFKGISYLSPVTFFKYEAQIKVLREEDFDDVISSGRPFARKIIVGQSDRLIDMLKNYH